MHALKFPIILFISTFFAACKNNESLPDNNNFSYLDSNKVEDSANPESMVTSEPSSESPKEFKCNKTHAEFIGKIMRKSVMLGKATNYEDFNVLTINQAYELNCDKNQKIKVQDIILNVGDDVKMDQYLGYSVFVIGDISASSENEYFPAHMDVIRIEPIKGSVQ